MKNSVKELIILIGITTITALFANWISPKGIALLGEWDTARGVITAKAKDDIIIRKIEIEDIGTAKSIYDTGLAVFVDARAKDMYDQGHIAGAVSWPMQEFEAQIEAFLKKYDPATPVVTYCSGRECDDSHKLAQLIISLGYTDVKVFVDGYPGWISKGYPIEPVNKNNIE